MVRENDLDLLQGSWRVTALAMDGQEMPTDMLANARIVIEGDRFRNSGMGAVYEGTIELDTSAKPRRLDMKLMPVPKKATPILRFMN